MSEPISTISSKKYEEVSTAEVEIVVDSAMSRKEIEPLSNKKEESEGSPVVDPSERKGYLYCRILFIKFITNFNYSLLY
jgi:hypothetical protein